MQTIINEALRNAEIEREMLKGIVAEDDFNGQPRIVIIGCGGAGNNTINRLHHMQVTGAETIAVNTDKQHLDMIQADKRILIGKSLTKGLGAGGYPDVGKRAAEMARSTLESVLENVDLCFVTAGMGGDMYFDGTEDMTRMAAISEVTLAPSKTPPLPGLAPWESLISKARTVSWAASWRSFSKDRLPSSFIFWIERE